MKKTLSFVAFLLLLIAAQAQETKKVAILKTVDLEGNVPYGIKLQLRSSLTYAIAHMPGYEAYDRVDMASIMDEQKFQRTGLVSDAQIKKLGEMTGAAFVLVAEAATYDENHIIITAKILDVQTAGIKEASDPEVSSTDPKEMKNACIQIARTLLGGASSSSSSTRPTSPRQAANSGSSQAVQTFTVGNVSFDMIKVEAGSFIMGCTSEQGSDCCVDESPYHRVTITNDYYIGKFEVTQELYEAVMGVNPSYWKAFDRPVEQVSWNDAMEFCSELSRLTGRRFTLPTEAEWEYAARGGKKSTNAKYSGSSSIATVAWYDGNSGSQTHPVGRLRANELGIYDMSGNVWEWCLDWMGNYSSATQTDPMGPGSGSCRVHRGGSSGNYDERCRVARRYCYSPDDRNIYGGFRVVLH